MRESTEQLIEQWREKNLEEDALLSEVMKAREVQHVRYSVFIDTFNLFNLARDGLDQVFDAISRRRLFDGIDLPECGGLRKPSIEEYAKFAELFLREIKNNYESRIISKIPRSISEGALRRVIRELMSEQRSSNDVPDADVVVNFKSETRLFGVNFNKEEHLRKIQMAEFYTTNEGDLTALRELKRNLVEFDTIIGSGRPKSYRFYNEFVSSLRDFNDKSKLPGFYKSHIEGGKFVYHSEKGVDTSLAVKSIETAYKDSSTHQIFCVADTDFLPVLEKLDEMGVEFFLVHCGDKKRLPKEFMRYRDQGKVTHPMFSDLSNRVTHDIVEAFATGADGYKGENRDGWRSIASAVQNEIQQQWQADDQAYWEQQIDVLVEKSNLS